MSKELYNFVSSYAKYEKIKDDSEAEITEGSTYSCDTTIFTEGCTDESFLHNCLIAKKYLNHIKNHEPLFNIKDACIYLSYWVYQEVVKNSKYNYNVSTFLENVMNAEYINVCKGYTENITKELFTKIQSLIALYKSLAEILKSVEQQQQDEGEDDDGGEDEDEEVEAEEDDCHNNTLFVTVYESLKDTCNLNSDKHLCNEVENFRRTYNDIMYRTNKCNQFKYLPSYQKHSEVSSITTSIVALSAVSFVSFISYKFTPFGSWIRNRISGGNNLMNKIDKENREAQYASERQDTPYRVGYHSSR